MPLQDLTPQLRTRLSHLERLVGWFLALAVLAFVAGLVFYLYILAERRGWFLRKMPYFTYVQNAAGLKVKDKVKLMGFDVGEIVEITAMPAEETVNHVFIKFVVKEPFDGYLWDDSRARVASGDLLGGRSIEVTKGTNGVPSYTFAELKQVSLHGSEAVAPSGSLSFAQIVAANGNIVAAPWLSVTSTQLQAVALLGSNSVFMADRSKISKDATGIWDDQAGIYRPFKKTSNGYFVLADESPALAQRLERTADAVEDALPVVLGFTNTIYRVLTNTESLAQKANGLLTSINPLVSNFTQISANLSGPKGSIGEWLLPTNLNAQLERTLGSADTALITANTNLAALSSSVLVSLEHMANLTSNLNAQVQANALILTEISDLIHTTDTMMQGLKRHWLLKGAFRSETNRPVQSVVKPSRGGTP